MKHYAQITKPTQEPITLADALPFLRASGAPEDTAMVAACVSTAREMAENFTGRALVVSGWRMVANSFTDLVLDRSPLVAVQSVKYYAPDASALTTLAPADYIVIAGTTPGSVQLLIDVPEVADRPDAVQVEFTAGSSSPADIPPTLTHAVRLLTQNLYDNRATFAPGTVNEIPLGLRHLLESQRVGGWVG